MKARVIKGLSKKRSKPEAPVTPAAPGTRFDRITFEPGKMGGQACIRGMRVTVGMVVSRIAEGASREEILKDYPYLEPEDIRQALGYAAWLTREEVIPA
jgi:uncharacterized protein (DUF433 family)